MSEALVLLVSVATVILTTIALGIAAENGLRRMIERAEEIR